MSMTANEQVQVKMDVYIQEQTRTSENECVCTTTSADGENECKQTNVICGVRVWKIERQNHALRMGANERIRVRASKYECK